jgi:predicted ArsR family transcriptional regulator
MADSDLAERVAGVAVLADPIRRELYLYVSSQAEPVSRDEAADALGIARHTAKFHLDKLAEEGLLDIDFKRLSDRRGPGAGRPTKLYRRSSRQLSVTLPERRYELAAQLMASAIDHATAAGSTVTDAVDAAAADCGHIVGDRARAEAGPRPSRERLLTSVCDALTDYGYEPHRDGRTITLSNCPFDSLAREHPELVCGMNLALLAAATDRVGRSGLVARLDPAPDRCCVVLDARPTS